MVFTAGMARIISQGLGGRGHTSQIWYACSSSVHSCLPLPSHCFMMLTLVSSLQSHWMHRERDPPARGKAEAHAGQRTLGENTAHEQPANCQRGPGQLGLDQAPCSTLIPNASSAPSETGPGAGPELGTSPDPVVLPARGALCSRTAGSSAEERFGTLLPPGVFFLDHQKDSVEDHCLQSGNDNPLVSMCRSYQLKNEDDFPPLLS